MIPGGTGGGGTGTLRSPTRPRATRARSATRAAASPPPPTISSTPRAGCTAPAPSSRPTGRATPPPPTTARRARSRTSRGAAETFRECAHAVSGYATALDHCQSEIKRLRHAWEEAKHRQAANEALALKLVNSITPTTEPDAATRVNTQATTASGQANDAGTEADHLALRAHTALTGFTQKASAYQSTLDGYSPGEATGPFGAPFTAPGTPGRTFGLPGDGLPLPGDAHSLDPYNGVIPVGDPWNSPIPGYGVYKDATTPEVEPTDDLTNLVLLVSTLGGSAAVDVGANALKALAEELGVGSIGRGAVGEAYNKAAQKVIDKAIASGESRSSSFVKILQRARAAGQDTAVETAVAQHEARADLLDALMEDADQGRPHRAAELRQPGGSGRGPDHRDYPPLQAMRLGRTSPTPEVDPEVADLLAGVYYAFEDNLERSARLTRLYHDGACASELKEEALAGAHRIAYVERVVFEAMAHVIDVRDLPPGALPMGVHGALARLAYALIALAEENPEPEALLSQDDLRNLAVEYGIVEWAERGREHNPDLGTANS